MFRHCSFTGNPSRGRSPSSPLSVCPPFFPLSQRHRNSEERGVIWGASCLPPSPAAAAAGQSVGRTTRISSSNCNMCQTALNLEPPPPPPSPSVTRFRCFCCVAADGRGRSVFVKKKGSAAAAIEVITGGRLELSALESAERGGLARAGEFYTSGAGWG